MPDRVREAPRKDREDAPEDAENAGESADLPLGQAEVRRHRGKQRRNDPTIESDEAEADAEQRDGSPFVGGIPTGGAACHRIAHGSGTSCVRRPDCSGWRRRGYYASTLIRRPPLADDIAGRACRRGTDDFVLANTPRSHFSEALS